MDDKLQKLIVEHNSLEKINFRNDEEEERFLQVKEEIKLMLEEQINEMSNEINPPPKILEAPKPQQVKPESKTKEETNKEMAEKYLKEHPEENKPENNQPEKKKKKTIFEYLMARRKEKQDQNKMTFDKLQQLKLEAQGAELEARIAKAKKSAKDNKPSRFSLGIPKKIFTDEGGSSYRRDKRALGDNHDERDYSSLTGGKNKKSKI